MQILKTSVIILITASLFMSCGNNERKEKTEAEIKEEILRTDPAEENKESGTATKLDGAWEIKRAEGAMAETNMGTIYEFKGNKLSFGKEGYKNPGITEITDSTFSFQAEGNELKFMYNYKFDGDTLEV